MAIGRIGSGYNNYYNNISQIRLQQALSRNPKYVQAVEAVDRVKKLGSSGISSSINFLKTYNSTMSDVMQSANALRKVNSSGVANDLTVSSSESSVAEVAERYPERTEKEFTLDVDQLAAAQQNVSAGVRGSENAAEDMNFTLAGNAGSVNVQVSAANEDGTYKTNRQMLREAAKQINESDAGVTAAVKEQDGVSTLELTGKKTGSDNDFTVTGQLGAAAGAENVSVDAQNAEYSVTDQYGTRSYSSASNKVQLDYGKIDATLKDTGSTTISSHLDGDKMASAVSDLVDSYNNALTFLNENGDRGIGVISQIGKFANNLASEKTLNRLGINTKKDGTLAFDKGKFKEALQKDPDLTKDLVTGSFGLAQTAFNRASSAMSANSASLVSSDLDESYQQSVNSPINFMNMFSKSGANNMNNYYAIGLMVNFLA